MNIGAVSYVCTACGRDEFAGERDFFDHISKMHGVRYMNFSHALGELKAGHRVQRSAWNGKGMYVELQVPDENSKMSLPYLYMKTADDKLVPWLASQTDILADDWSVVE